MQAQKLDGVSHPALALLRPVRKLDYLERQQQDQRYGLRTSDLEALVRKPYVP